MCQKCQILVTEELHVFPLPREAHLFQDPSALSEILCLKQYVSCQPTCLLFVSPRLMSPMSFFFGPFPKLRLRDHEKKMPRFLSALSSLPSSFSDRPDLCFLASCQLQNKSEELAFWAVRYNNITHIHKEWLLEPFSGWRVWSGQSWRYVWRVLGCRGSDKGLARVGHPPQHACTLGRARTWGSVSSCRTSSGWRSVAQNVKKWGCDVRERKLAKD